MSVSEHLLAVARDLRGTDLRAMGAPTGFVVRQCAICEAEGYGTVPATVRLCATGVLHWVGLSQVASRSAEHDVCARHGEALVLLLTGGSPSQRRTIHVAAERSLESMAYDVMTPGVAPFPVHHLVVSSHWAPDPLVEYWCQVAGVWTDGDGRLGHQLGLWTNLDSELVNHAVTTLDAEGIQACARGVVAAGRGSGRFRAIPADSDLSGYVRQVVTGLDDLPWDGESYRAEVGLFCVAPQSCFERHGQEG